MRDERQTLLSRVRLEVGGLESYDRPDSLGRGSKATGSIAIAPPSLHASRNFDTQVVQQQQQTNLKSEFPFEDLRATVISRFIGSADSNHLRAGLHSPTFPGTLWQSNSSAYRLFRKNTRSLNKAGLFPSRCRSLAYLLILHRIANKHPVKAATRSTTTREQRGSKGSKKRHVEG